MKELDGPFKYTGTKFTADLPLVNHGKHTKINTYTYIPDSHYKK